MAAQSGHIWKENGAWYGRWRQDVVTPEGTTKRVQKSKKLVEYSDKYRTEKDVQPLLDEILQPLNAGKVDVRSTMAITTFVDSKYLPFVRENHKASTYNGYSKLWAKHLSPRLQGKELREFRTVDAANLLSDLARVGLNKHSIQHAKSLLSGIFTYAKNVGVLDGVNPVRDAMIPKKAKRPEETHASTAEEVTALLSHLEAKAKEAEDEDKRIGLAKARAAVALVYFAGLRPGEARGVNWEDYDGKRLQVRHSVWRTKRSDPKTPGSVKPVPIIEPLKTILAELKKLDGEPKSGPILRGSKGKPLNLDNLYRREIAPALACCSICRKSEGEHEKNGHEFKLDESLPKWRGWYSFRRGIATLTSSIAHDPQAAKGLLRHSNLATTLTHYVKDVPEVTERAMQAVEQLFAPKEAVQ